jgi:PAS domain S-box-containing protein
MTSTPASHLEELVALLPHVFFVMDRNLRHLYVSPSSTKLTGLPPLSLIGKTLRETDVSPVTCDALEEAARRTLEGAHAVADVTISGRICRIRLFPQRDANDEIVSLAGIAEDITEAKHAEDVLRDSNASLRALIEPWADAVWEATPEGVVVSTCGGHTRQTAPEWRGIAWLEAIHPDDREYAERQWREAVAAMHPVNAEFRLRRGDGGWCWTNMHASPVMDSDGGIKKWVGINIDITERKRDEQRLRDSREQLRQLASNLQDIREEEKSRIARDLHDQLAQVLTALKLSVRSVEWAVGDLPPSEGINPLLDRAVAASDMADDALASVRRIALELRPGTLDRLGLGAALRDEARRFAARTRVQCETVVPEQVPDMNPEVATAIYRICQEALTNVMRHANASRVAILLEVGPNSIVLKVEDDGKGLDPSTIEHASGLGLLGIVERARALGGYVNFESGSGGCGTAVVARIPFRLASSKEYSQAIRAIIAARGSKPVRVGISAPAMAEYYNEIFAGMFAKMKEWNDLYGLKFEYVIETNTEHDKIELQVATIKTWADEGFDAVVICTAADAASMDQLFGEMLKKGTYTYFFNMPPRQLFLEPGSPLNVYAMNARASVGYDNFLAHYDAGNWIAELLTKKCGEPRGRIGQVWGPPGHWSIDRGNGFKEAMKKFPNINVVALVRGDYTRSGGMRAAEELLTRAPDLDVVYSENEEMGLAAAAAAMNAGMKLWDWDKRTGLAVLAADGGVTGYNEIAAGRLTATIDVNPVQNGRELVDAIVFDRVLGWRVSKIINTPTQVVDKRNLDLHRSLDEWAVTIYYPSGGY